MTNEEKLIIGEIRNILKKKRAGVTLQMIADCTCDYLGCRLEDVLGPCRIAKFCMARDVICILSRHYKLNYSMSTVAKFLGRKSHASVFNSYKKNRYRETDNVVKDVDNIIQQRIVDIIK